jgi:hypothetical protein
LSPGRAGALARTGGHGAAAQLAFLLALFGALASSTAQPRHRPRPRPRGDSPVAPPSPVATPLPGQKPANLPLAAVRLECANDGPTSRACETILEAAGESLRRKYQLIAPEKLEELLNREPSLRGCRRDDCRAAIAEKLELSRLIDIIIQTQKHHKTSATVLVFDPGAKGISADTETQLKPEEDKLRSTIIEAVDRVMLTQKSSAGLKLEVKPAGVRVTVKDGRGNARVLTDAERDGIKDVRLFLGTYTLHVEKPGFIAQDPTVTVTQAGASLQVELKTQPVKVKLEWQPPEAQVLVDGIRVDPRERSVELPEGTHHFEALAPRGSPYESWADDIAVKPGMEPLRIALQQLTELRIKAPEGYTVSVDNQLLPTSGLPASSYMVETGYPITAGPHTVSAVSWRGLQLTRRIEVLPRASTNVVLNPPLLAPGLVLMAAGAASLVTGGVLLAYDGQPSDALGLFRHNFTVGAAVALSAGAVALLAGTIWFGHNAANHPRFHRADTSRSALLRQRLLVVPSLGIASAGILSEIKF